MEAGASVWVKAPDSEEAWLLCEILKKTADELTLKDQGSGKEIVRGLESKDEETGATKFDGVELANTPLSQEEKKEGRDNDLISLPYLHEPALLHALSDRFFRGEIYTWTGPVLLAVNPFQRLPLYTDKILETYRRDGLMRAQGIQGSAKLGPHIFAIADRAYRQMMGEKRCSQAILISGESGAGKTESTKIVLIYLTTLGGGQEAAAKKEEDDSVMQRVLKSNPVLEAFGNGKTLRNDNSSRFGKFMELGFNRAGQLMGAKVQTYLLEKVRIAFHAAGERNYHIFYQLLRGCKEEDRAKYHFYDGMTGGLELPNYFHYTGQGGAPHLREFTDDSAYDYTVKGMTRLGWTQETIDGVMEMIAGILHLGQIHFNSVEKDGVETAEVADEKIMGYASGLLGVDTELLKTALTERIILARGQEIKAALTPEKASDARDALAKTIYGALFLWVVDKVNQSLLWKDDNDIRSSCGVLDIFGFECFAINSFEQLCINFTNEALQQQFNQFIFKLEQQEYNAEGISWAFIEFPDNQDCLDTIQLPKTGILSMLDEECKLPKGSDRNWVKRMFEQYLPEKKQTVSENTRFHATNVQKAKGIFCVRHYAGLVQYTAETNFMDKNKDEIPITARNLFDSAPSQLIKDTFAIQKREMESRESKPTGKAARAPKQKTVGQQFKEQLNGLIASVQKTDPHYIRCIKPNDAAKPLLMTRKRTTEQLRYGGVLEAVKVARAGFPVRMPHAEFYSRYRMLLPTTPDRVLPWSMEGHEPQKICVKLVEEVLAEGEKHAEGGRLDPNEPGISRAEKIRRTANQPVDMKYPKADVQLGKTKVFMRKHPHDCMEAHRVFHQGTSAILMQCWARGLAEQRKYFIIIHSIRLIQRTYRGAKGRERWTDLRKGDAGMLLTKVFRMLIHWRKYNRARKGTVRFQALMRGRNRRRVLAAVKVEKHYRMYTARKKFRMMASAVVALQCATRKRIATKFLTELKREQKDVGKLKQNNEKLKQEMASLKAMLSAQASAGAASEAHNLAIKEKEEKIAELEKRIAEIEKELAKEKATVERLENELANERENASKEREMQMNRVSQMGIEVKRGPGAAPPPPAQMSPKAPSRKATLPPSSIPEDYVSPAALEEHRVRVNNLSRELESERRLRREADGEIIKLRAAMNGVQLNETEVKALLSQQSDDATATLSRTSSATSEFTAASSVPESTEFVKKPMGRRASAFDVSGGKARNVGVEPVRRSASSVMGGISRAVSSVDLIPMIRRGFVGQEEKQAEDVVAVGWKTEIRNRREREEMLRDEVHRFESKMKKSMSILEEGIETVMWQLNRGSPEVGGGEVTDEFAVKSSNVTVKFQRKGEMLVQCVLAFMGRGGYLSKAIGRTRTGEKTAIDPLALNDILEVKAGCVGFDHTELPSSSKAKAKKSSKSDNTQVSLFMTIKATPVPSASQRSYIFRFKSRSARNDVLNGLRNVLADMQVHEGVSVSGLTSQKETTPEDDEEILVPLSAVHEVINRERENYDRILLMLLQGGEDLKEKEDQLLSLRQKLQSVSQESREKDRVQANDSKLIMQLSKKLETLLMDNEDLRDQNDRLNTRLVTIEAEQMNLSVRGA